MEFRVEIDFCVPYDPDEEDFDMPAVPPPTENLKFTIKADSFEAAERAAEERLRFYVKEHYADGRNNVCFVGSSSAIRTLKESGLWETKGIKVGERLFFEE